MKRCSIGSPLPGNPSSSIHAPRRSKSIIGPPSRWPPRVVSARGGPGGAAPRGWAPIRRRRVGAPERRPEGGTANSEPNLRFGEESRSQVADLQFEVLRELLASRILLARDPLRRPHPVGRPVVAQHLTGDGDLVHL